MDNPVLPPSTAVEAPPITVTSLAGEDGFYTDTPPSEPVDNTFHLAPDRKNLIIGCALGTLTFILLVIGFILAIKLYFRKKRKEEMKEQQYMKEFDEEEEEENHQWMMADDEEGRRRRESSTNTSNNNNAGLLSLPTSSNISSSSRHCNGSSKKLLQLSSILDPGSQFSLAVQRASEIPNSPTI